MAKYKNITEPDKHGYQVRIVRNGKEFSRYFSHRMWGGKGKSLEGAQSWRDQMHAILGTLRPRLHQQPSPTKRSTGVCGVSRSLQFDKRRDTHNLVYEVHWNDGSGTRNKTFHVGRVGEVSADKEFHAFRTAVLFRRHYELAVELGERFDSSLYTQWKELRLYDSRTVTD